MAPKREGAAAPTISSLIKDRTTIRKRIEALDTGARIVVLAHVQQGFEHMDSQRSALGAIMVCACHGLDEQDARAMFKAVAAELQPPGELNRTFIQYRSNILRAYRLGMHLDDYESETRLRAECRKVRAAQHKTQSLRSSLDDVGTRPMQLPAVKQSNAARHKAFSAWYDSLPHALRAKFWELSESIISAIDDKLEADNVKAKNVRTRRAKSGASERAAEDVAAGGK